MTARPKGFAESFLEYFDLHYVANQSQLKDVGRIRYRVYCEEFEYEPKESFPDGIEHDEFDASSLHALIIHKETNRPAGCVRMVCPHPGTDYLMPFEKHCGADTLDQGFFEKFPINRDTTCEISRLAVDGIFRRRTGEKATRFGGVSIPDISHQEQRTYPLIAVSCFLAAAALGDLADKTSAFAMMEPFLPRLMSYSGLNFTQAGESLEYHGMRAPYFLTMDEAMADMAPELKELYGAIHETMKKDFVSPPTFI